MAEQRVLGGFEMVSFPEFGVMDVIAKVDTGAYSGALHATHAREIETTDGSGSKLLEFYPLGKKDLMTRTADYRRKTVKSSNGQIETRYVIKTQIIIQGASYPIRISLSDRSAMMKSVIIGRQFLRRHRFVVDVREGTKFRFNGKSTATK